ncbi:ABC transporter permease [Vibrio genomosp. F10]|uniref:ABC transporter permease n=1 Tax=Vibrio genomosp. F10 TaxID=723171 RepID=UPI0002E53AB5|nr:ABC transporter permease [Vibrio genomosp. F10]OEF07741.1 multidrug ABC transporter permease [Vibrio genomosp. F10 str. 9ZB36]
MALIRQQYLRQQYQILKQDKWLLACVSWIPIALALCIWGIFSAGIARDLPIGVVDLAHSPMSKRLSHQLDASSTLKIETQFSDVSQAKDALVESRIYAYVVIPDGFDKGIYRQSLPQVSVFYNSQYILVGRLINSAVMQSIGYFNASIETVQNLSFGDTPTLSALGKAVPVSTQITALFNQNTNYAQFLVSAIVPALWQVVIVVSTIMVLAANYRRFDGLHPWLGSSPIHTLYHTLKGYIGVFALQGVLFLAWFYQGLGWPMQGAFLPIIVAQFMMILACMIMGCLFFFLTLDATRAMSFAGAFTAPSFAFMGITFPVTDMNMLAQWWRALLPVSHYIEVQVSQASYGVSALDSMTHLTPMLGYFFAALLCLWLIKQHYQREQAQ